jgi:hypothetical protein
MDSSTSNTRAEALLSVGAPRLNCTNQATIDFLRDNRELLQLCIFSANHLSALFGDGASYQLELRTEERPELFFFAETTLKVKEAISRLDQFEADFWLELFAEKRAMMSFHLRFSKEIFYSIDGFNSHLRSLPHVEISNALDHHHKTH